MPAYQTPLLRARPGETIISPWSYQSLGPQIYSAVLAGPASGATVAAGMVMYVPFWVPEAFRITKLWWGNGSGVAGDVDAGVYDPAGTLLVSAGTTAQATVSVVQSVDTTDTTIARGTYYMALVGSTVTTQTFQRTVPVAGICQALGILQQDISGTGLPLATNASPATFAKCTTAWLPFFGVQGYRAIGP